jgi:hypothetical protein
MPLTLINDTHLGVQRNAGTTPRSSSALKEWLNSEFASLVHRAEGDLCILGDLFDQYLVPNTDLVSAVATLSFWCKQHPHNTLHLVAGNHDLSKDSSRLSSFEVLCQLLEYMHKNVSIHMEPGWVKEGVWVIPHCVNQDLFDIYLEQVPEGTRVLLLHANYDNFHAEQSDGSLNVKESVAQGLVERGVTLVFAHEHQHRLALDGNVIVVGNQIPTSVADCLGAPNKYKLEIDGEAPRLVRVLQVSDVFERRDWRNLGTPPLSGDTKFIRVEGSATANEAADVVTAISKYRSKSDAFVITNAVKIEGISELKDLPATLEAAKAFDVLSAILETLDERERVVVKKLLQEGSTC